MRRAFRQPLAVAFALLVVTAGALGGAFVFNDDVTSLEGASDEYVQRGAAFNPSDGLILGYASGVIETYQSFVGDNQPTDDLEAADWQETHKNVYQAHITQNGNADSQLSILENYLNDTRSIALMQGKKAYVTALENGATEGEAEMSALDAVEGYYLTKQRNLISAWNMTMQTTWNGLNQAESAGKNPSDLYSVDGWDGSLGLNVGNKSVELVDGSSATAKGYWAPGASQIISFEYDYASTVHVRSPPNTQFSKRPIVDHNRWRSAWTQIETQNQEVQTQLSNFVTATYSNYQAGDLNASDFVDPYMGAREYSPETSNTWTLRTLSSMGVNPPENLSNIGRMNVTANGVTYTGVLMSDGTPAGGFMVGQTYNASQLGGPQWVALDSGGAQQLEGEFTLESATRADGPDYEANESVAYRNVTYETANLSEMRELNEDLNELQAQIDARQQRLRNSGGVGWLPDFGGLSVGSVAPVVLIAGGALVLLGRN
jgi:hypothetical protein